MEESTNKYPKTNISNTETDQKTAAENKSVDNPIPHEEITSDTSPSQKARITRVINEFKTEASNILNNAKESHARIIELNSESEALKKQIDIALEDIKGKSSIISEKGIDITKLHTEFFTSVSGKKSIENGIKKAEEEIKKSAESIRIKKVDFDEYYDKLFGSKNEAGKETIGLKQEAEENKNKLEDLYKQEAEKFKALFDKIEGLLSGATSVGLARAFADQKKNYSTPNILWSTIFVLTMLSMATFGFFTWRDIIGSGEFTISLIMSRILARTPFFIATIWLGYFASKQQSQNKRLEQEYAHKESAARSYEGFKRQIDSLDQTKENTALSLKLLTNIVESIGYNPSVTLDNESHREEPPLLDKVLSLTNDVKKV